MCDKSTSEIYTVVYDTTRPDDETVGIGSHRRQGAHEIGLNKHVYVHAEGYEHERDGGYTNHGKCGEYVAGGHSVCIQLIRWYGRAEVPGHNGICTDDKHASWGLASFATLQATIRYKVFIDRNGFPVLLPAGHTGAGRVGVLVLTTTRYGVSQRGRPLAGWSTGRSISVPTHSITGTTEVIDP